MAAYGATAADYLQRTTSLPSLAGDYTVLYWQRLSSGQPVNPDYRLGYALLDNPAIYADYWETWLTATDSGVPNTVLFEATGGVGTRIVDGTAPAVGTWMHIALTKASTLQTLVRDGGIAGTVVYDPSALVLGYELLGGDAFSITDHAVAYCRTWSVALSLAEILRERASATAVKTSGLRMDTPLTADALDISGNGRHWTEVGTITYVAGPSLPVGPTEGQALGWAGGAHLVGPRVRGAAVATGGWER